MPDPIGHLVGQSIPIALRCASRAYSRGLPYTSGAGDERVAAAGGRGASFAAPLRGLLHSGPSHDILRHRFAITCLSRAPRRYIGPRVDKPAPTLAAPPFFSSPSVLVVSPVYAFECRPGTLFRAYRRRSMLLSVDQEHLVQSSDFLHSLFSPIAVIRGLLSLFFPTLLLRHSRLDRESLLHCPLRHLRGNPRSSSFQGLLCYVAMDCPCFKPRAVHTYTPLACLQSILPWIAFHA